MSGRDEQRAQRIADPPDRQNRAWPSLIGIFAEPPRREPKLALTGVCRAPPPPSSSTSCSGLSRGRTRTAASSAAPTTASSVLPAAITAAPQTGPVVALTTNAARETAGQSCGRR